VSQLIQYSDIAKELGYECN